MTRSINYLLFIVMLFTIGCMTTRNNGNSSLLKYKCVNSFVSQGVKFTEASKWCSENFKTINPIEGE